jgi:predicted transcriptional regulator
MRGFEVGFIDRLEWRRGRRRFVGGQVDGDAMAKRSMGELEGALMDILWDRGGWLTPGEVHASLDDSSLAYTTVMTILVRLWRKGRLERQRDGRAYAYHPVVTREQYAATRMEDVLAQARDRAAVLSRFLDGMDPADRAQLRRLLNSYRSP